VLTFLLFTHKIYRNLSDQKRWTGPESYLFKIILYIKKVTKLSHESQFTDKLDKKLVNILDF
jgi:hypothetical protein